MGREGVGGAGQPGRLPARAAGAGGGAQRAVVLPALPDVPVLTMPPLKDC